LISGNENKEACGIFMCQDGTTFKIEILLSRISTKNEVPKDLSKGLEDHRKLFGRFKRGNIHCKWGERVRRELIIIS